MNKTFYRNKRPKKKSFKKPLSLQAKEKVRKELLRLNRKTCEFITSLPDESHTKSQKTKIVLDVWQTKALDALEKGSHVIVDAPTSAGKTKVIESYINRHLNDGFKIIYTSPVKSLSNDKYFEFIEIYGKTKVGINTGDFKENLEAPIVFATLETYRNSLLGLDDKLAANIVVLDEYHYIQDESRGSAWEEAIILTYPKTQLLLLSASVPNTNDFSRWIKTTLKKDVEIITVKKRPVPLVNLIYSEVGFVSEDLIKNSKEDIRRYLSKNNLSDKSWAILPYCTLNAISLGLSPIVIYTGKRLDAERVVANLQTYLDGLSFDKKKIQEIKPEIPGWDYLPKNLKGLIENYGIAFHHSGLIPIARLAIEYLLKRGLLRVCVGTMGISLGVNFAVKSALILDARRPDEKGEVFYSNSEVLQMLGRAGRRGIDKNGYSLWVNYNRYLLQKAKSREDCLSSLKFEPSTVLSLFMRYGSVKDISHFYRRSFLFQGKETIDTLVDDHDILHSSLYTKYGNLDLGCEDIPKNMRLYKEKSQKSLCLKCSIKKLCHKNQNVLRHSKLNNILVHLKRIQAIRNESLTYFGQISRYFPQTGGLIIANWIATKKLNSESFMDYLQAIAVFTAPCFKDVTNVSADIDFIKSLEIEKLIEHFYPFHLFRDYYDEPLHIKRRTQFVQFRDFNKNAGSLINFWLNPHNTWHDLVSLHKTKFFSEGDCINVIYRFSTFLQSFVRMRKILPALSQEASSVLDLISREPIDSRRKLGEEIN